MNECERIDKLESSLKPCGIWWYCIKMNEKIRNKKTAKERFNCVLVPVVGLEPTRFMGGGF